MVVVSHLFLFLCKNFREDVTRMSHIFPCLELSISRQPLYFPNFIKRIDFKYNLHSTN